jgi:hypothetical protein
MKITEVTQPNFPLLVESHLEHQIPLEDNIFRILSEAWSQFFQEARALCEQSPERFHEDDRELLGTEIGTWAEYRGQRVPLDVPVMESLLEAEYKGKKVELGKPRRGGSKKFYVYVRNPKTGNIKRISFGDTTGLSVKINDPKRRASFAARHRCEQANDRMSARYWACRLPRFRKSLGLSGSGGTWW